MSQSSKSQAAPNAREAPNPKIQRDFALRALANYRIAVVDRFLETAYRDYTTDIEDTFRKRTEGFRTACQRIERETGFDVAEKDYRRWGTRRPHDYKVPLNLWDETPD